MTKRFQYIITLCLTLSASFSAFTLGGTWSVVPGGPTCKAIAAVGLGVVSVGNPLSGTSNGISGYYNGSSWSMTSTPNGGHGMSAISATSLNNIYACGTGGSAMFSDGGGWTTIFPGVAYNLIGVWASTNKTYFIGAQSQIVQRINGVFSNSVIPGMVSTKGLWVSATDDVFVVGGSSIARKSPGYTWTITPSPGGSSDSLNAVWGSSATDIWCVGDGGRICHSDGFNWLRVASPTTSNLYSVWGTGPNDVYAVGAGDYTYQYDGVSWRIGAGKSAVNDYINVRCSNGEVYCLDSNGNLMIKSHPNMVTMIGYVSLEGYVGDNPPACKFKVGNGPTVVITLTPDGPPGKYKFFVNIEAQSTTLVSIIAQDYKPQTNTVTAGYTTVTSTFDGPNHTGMVPGDVNGDGIIDDTDILEVINHFLSTTYRAADINGDGIVDDTDLLAVINHFLQ